MKTQQLVSIGVVSGGLLTSFASFLYTKGYLTKYYADDARWVSPLYFSLNSWDLLSDILFTLSLVRNAERHGTRLGDFAHDGAHGFDRTRGALEVDRGVAVVGDHQLLRCVDHHVRIR